jgi:hypothetical protein
MVSGIMVINGEPRTGPVVEITYPAECKVSDDEVQCFLVYTQKNDRKVPFGMGEILLNEKFFLLVWKKSQESRATLDIIVLILQEREKIKIDSIKMLFYYFAKYVINKLKDERQGYILENFFIFFPRTKEKKLIFIGHTGSGKTTIRGIIFEGNNPSDYLTNPVEPTRGIETNVYSWLDLKAGVFDTSGQDFNKILKDNYEQEMLFDSADIIVFVVDISKWFENEDTILAEIERVDQIRRLRGIKSRMALFMHKMDLLPINGRIQYLLGLKEKITRSFDGDIFFTSIHPDYLFSLHSAFSTLLSFSSSEARVLKLILDESIASIQKTMLCISNTDDMIVAQSANIDFDLSHVNHLHKLMGQILLTVKDARPHDRVSFVTLETVNKFVVKFENLHFSQSQLGFIFCFSETLTLEMEQELIRTTIEQLQELYSDKMIEGGVEE